MVTHTPLTVEQWPIERIRPFPRNVRLHSEQQLHFITQSILQFGFCNPILVDSEGECIAGHGRLQAMKLLEKTEVPVIVLGHLTPDQAKAYRIADNQIPLSAGWDEERYREQLQEFMSSEFPMEALGWGADELNKFLSVGNPGLTDPDEVPEPSKQPAVLLGELWNLGGHRLYIGDCTTRENVKTLLNKQKPNLMVTDPPYGVEYDADWRNSALRKSGKPIGGRAIGKVNNDDRVDWTEAWKLFDGNIAYIWHGALHCGDMIDQLEECNFKGRALIVWAKNNIVVSRGHYHWQHETCWYAVRNGKQANWNGDRSQTTLWSIDKPLKSETGHSAQKPVECMERPIINNSAPKEFIYDPFVGSGTTIIAAEMTDRKCLAMEIDPTYAQVSIERWQNFTGEKATLNGQSFADVAQERSNETSHRRVAVPGSDIARVRAKRKVRAKMSAR